MSIGESKSRARGQIITFYSYKGGTGRSMGLANFAWALATAGKSVLAIDWDLEAPGLHRYFHPFISDPELTSTEGVIDFVIRFIEAASAQPSDKKASADWYRPYASIAHYANSVDYPFPNGGVLDFIPAGKQGEAYAARVNSLNWKHFYEKLGGWAVMEEMSANLRDLYEFILIDSRTGVSDTSGICTIQLPDNVVVCFTLNFQSIDGASGVARSIFEHRTKLSKPVKIFPVSMRVEVGAEKVKYEQVSNYALQRFFPTAVEQEVLAGAATRTYWDHVAVPYIGFYAFEEQLAWFLDSNLTTGVLASTIRLAKYVTGVDALGLPGPTTTEREDVLKLYAAVWAERLREHRRSDFGRTCFVIMPFGKKLVGDQTVDFDKLYDDIFVPAISAVPLPEGGKLEPHRIDKDFFTGDIKLEMFQYLEYSRFALADISGLNFNVAYELGTRHRARESGTAIFRQIQFAPPFDISSIKAFPYEIEPADKAAESRALITRVLTESLKHNRLDSPIRLALGEQRASGKIDDMLVQAENDIRKLNWTGAMDIYRQAIKIDPSNPLTRMKLGLLCRDREVWDEALEQFTRATAVAPSYGEAWREKGIVENKTAQQARLPLGTDPAPGELSLRTAIGLNDNDFDAFASLGGILKRAKRFPQAQAAYEQSFKVSGGHPYPLLNALKLRVQVNGRLALSGPEKLALAQAERVREGQSQQNPPFDRPWCFFDLAEIKLYRGDSKAFVDIAIKGFEQTDADWQGKTFIDTLRLLLPAADELPGLKEGLAELELMADSFQPAMHERP
jgi:cellulose biosynthesis protein BcsQ/tetratricopeptide (TPR) repeat protein